MVTASLVTVPGALPFQLAVRLPEQPVFALYLAASLAGSLAEAVASAVPAAPDPVV
jgi:hypothetical protein